MGLVKKFALLILGAGLMLGCGIYLWAIAPVSMDREKPDPAVLLLSQRNSGSGTYSEEYHRFSGDSLHYVEAGNGETIVFLHGFPSFWLSFVRQVDHFRNDYHVIAVDSLGAGKSDAPGQVEHYKLEAMSAHLEALINHLGEEKVHLVGHDWGAALAIGFAQEYPDKVLSVTGISAPSLNATLHAFEVDPEAKETAGYVERFKQANPALLMLLGTADTIYDGAYRPLVEDGKLTVKEGELFRNATSDMKRINAHINWYRANLPHPDDVTEGDYWPSKNARISMPALYIWDEEDPIYNKTALQRLISLSSQSDLLLLPETGHWPHVRASEAVNEALAKHFRAASKAGNGISN